MQREYRAEEGYTSSIDFAESLGITKSALHYRRQAGMIPKATATLQKNGRVWAWPTPVVDDYLRRSAGVTTRKGLRIVAAQVDLAHSREVPPILAELLTAKGTQMLSQTETKQALDTLPAQARKIFEFVPVCNEWSSREMISEMGRKGVRMDFKMFLHWINELKKAALVREPRPGFFIRAKTREPLALVEPQPQKATDMQTKPTEKTTLLDDLSPLTAQLRALADRIDAVILDHSQREEAGSEAEGKLNALRSLLKSIA